MQREISLHALAGAVNPTSRPFLPAPTFVAILKTIEKKPGNTFNPSPNTD
jgi:hypothetical protein